MIRNFAEHKMNALRRIVESAIAKMLNTASTCELELVAFAVIDIKTHVHIFISPLFNT